MSDRLIYIEIGPNLLRLELARLKAGSPDQIGRLIEMAGRIEESVNTLPERIAKEIGEIADVYKTELETIKANIGDPVAIEAALERSFGLLDGMSDEIRRRLNSAPTDPNPPNPPVNPPVNDGGQGENPSTDPVIG